MFTSSQVNFMMEHDIDPEDLDNVYEKIDALMRSKGWNQNYVFNDIGNMCEGILDTLSELDD